MRILLIDVDSKIPNIALMKLSTYYKQQGHEIELKRLSLDYYKTNDNQIMIYADDYHKVYASVIFKCNKNKFKIINCNDITIGGSGYSLDIKLPQEIDDCEEDYTLYLENDASYGFITRGCIRNCYFCIVPQKEGQISLYRHPEYIVKHKKVYFLDNNILAYPHHIAILEYLRDNNIRCQFNQGLDIRLINDNNAKVLSEINYIGEYYFAFDNINSKQIIEEKLKILKKYITKDWKIKFFLYCHPDMSIKEDVMVRINWCKEHKYLPYLMRDESCFSNKNNKVYTDLAAWCNQPNLFKKLSFEIFMIKRHNNQQRINDVISHSMRCCVFGDRECNKLCKYVAKCWHRKTMMDKRKQKRSIHLFTIFSVKMTFFGLFCI